MPWEYETRSKAIKGFFIDILGVIVTGTVLISSIIFFGLISIMFLPASSQPGAGMHLVGVAFIMILYGPIISSILYIISFKTSPLKATLGKIVFGVSVSQEKINVKQLLLHFIGILFFVTGLTLLPIGIGAVIFLVSGLFMLHINSKSSPIGKTAHKK